MLFLKVSTVSIESELKKIKQAKVNRFELLDDYKKIKLKVLIILKIRNMLIIKSILACLHLCYQSLQSL